MEAQNEKTKKLIAQRQTKLESERATVNERMQEVADYVAPHRQDIYGNLQKGAKKGTKIYDGTAEGAAVLAADGVHGYHVSPAFPWFKYVMNRKKANQIPSVREWLQECEFNIYTALNRSNFYNEIWMFIFDGFTIGTAAQYAEEDLAEGRIIFETVHPGETYLQENKYGEVDLLHRKRKMTARQIAQRFGEGNIPPAVKQCEETNPFQEFEIIHAVYPRDDFDERKLDAKSKRFASCWYMPAGNHLLLESGFRRFPYQVWRYMRTGKEPYGISPAMLAMADIKGLNLMSKTILGAAQLSIDPAYNVPAYLQGRTDLRPRGLNFFKEGTTDKITPVNSGEKYPIAIDREQDKQNAIKERFHVDVFLMLSQLAMQRGQRTAYEVSELLGEKAAVLGAELGPLNTEMDHILEAVFQIESEAGRIPPPPPELYELAAQDPHLRFDPLYMGPLAQAQRERFSKEGVRKFFVDIAPLVEIQIKANGGIAEILDNFDMDEAGRVLADSDNVPAQIIRPKQFVEQTRKGRLADQQQMMQQERTAAALDSLKTASEASRNMGGQGEIQGAVAQ